MNSRGFSHLNHHPKVRGRPRKQFEQHDDSYEVNFHRTCRDAVTGKGDS